MVQCHKLITILEEGRVTTRKKRHKKIDKNGTNKEVHLDY